MSTKTGFAPSKAIVSAVDKCKGDVIIHHHFYVKNINASNKAGFQRMRA